MTNIKFLMCVGAFLSCFLNISYAAQSDAERIAEEVDTFSVHLALGLKVITSNPNDLPELNQARETLAGIYQLAQLKAPSESFSLSQIADIGKIAFKARALGKEEVAKGKKTEFRYMVLLQKSLGKSFDLDLTVEQDHAITLTAMQLMKMQGVVIMPISKRMKLYEAWMAGDATFEHDYTNLAVRAAQAATYAQNDYCDVAENQLSKMRNIPLAQINTEQVSQFINQSLALEAIDEHAPKALSGILSMVTSPEIIAMAPGALKVYAHMESGGCFERKDKEGAAYVQYNHAINAMVEMGIPETEVAFFRSYVAIKQHNYPEAKAHLKQAANSELLDERGKEDILTLANTIKGADNALVEKYFNSVNVSIYMAKILNQRLVDEGFYEQLTQLDDVKVLSKIFDQVMSVDTGGLFDVGKGLFDKLF